MVYVFKTSVKFKKQIKQIALQLDHINEIKKWNFDLEDCDKILRIEAKNLQPSIISNILNSINCYCTKL